MRDDAASVAFATVLALAGPIGAAEPASDAAGPPQVEGGERIALFEDTGHPSPPGAPPSRPVGGTTLQESCAALSHP